MENRPQGRPKHVSGEGKPVYKRGEGLNTGSVGKSDAYQGRRGESSPNFSDNGNNQQTFSQSSGTPVRSGGLSKIIIIIVVILAILYFTKGLNLGSLLGGGDLGNYGGMTDTFNTESLFGSTGSTSTSGWTVSSNTGKLNTSVASGSRAKRTNIIGNGNDVVTIMVYMCGTDLESKSGMASNDLQEMAKATIGKNVNLIVYTGGCKQWKNNVVSSNTNQIFKVENGGLVTLVKDAGNASMTSPATLTSFIKYATQNYPANRYDLIMWDHGGGSISGFGYDEKNKTSGSMTLKGINEALKNAGTTFDFVGFDACLMATLENALMLDNYADYLIGSEETEPGVGWYYTNWLTKLSENTSMPTIEIGKIIVDDFVSYCNQKCPGQKTTLSVVDLAELTNTVPANFKNFASSTSELIESDNYKLVSDARSSTREFSPSSKIDQVDLVHFAYNLNTDAGKSLADSILGAVKYNKTSSSISNAYGLSIYFPYKRTSKVDSAVETYEAIGLDSEYSRCIQNFASLEVCGQAASGGDTSPFPSLFGSLTSSQSSSSSSSSLGNITDLIGGLLGGDLGSFADLAMTGAQFLGKGIDADYAADYITDNHLDSTSLVWTDVNGKKVVHLSEDQWSLVHDLQLNVFYDDGNGYIDLGLDNVFEFTDDKDLLGEYDNTWLAIDKQPVPYYYVDGIYDGDKYIITGRVPVMLNDTRTNLIIVFDNDHPYGYIAGARTDYVEGETDTVAKGITELHTGDKIDFICDYYSYDGAYQNSYLFGDSIVYSGDEEISNVTISNPEKLTASYMFTDIYNQEYWTPAIEK